MWSPPDLLEGAALSPHDRAIAELDEIIAAEMDRAGYTSTARHRAPFPQTFSQLVTHTKPSPPSTLHNPSFCAPDTPSPCAIRAPATTGAAGGANSADSEPHALGAGAARDASEVLKIQNANLKSSPLIDDDDIEAGLEHPAPKSLAESFGNPISAKQQSKFDSIRMAFGMDNRSLRLSMHNSSWVTALDDAMLDEIYDDDDLDEEDVYYRPVRWHTVYAVFTLTHTGCKASEKAAQVAGHAANFRREQGYVLKALCRSEGVIFESLSKQAALRPFVPQFMGLVERDDTTYIKMQDVLLSMSEPNLMDVKMGVRTFGEEEVRNNKRRMDLLQKALVIQANSPSLEITEDEKENGITKYRFMALRDQASSSGSLGFRIQGMKLGKKTFGSKDFSTLHTVEDYGPLFLDFFSPASDHQRTGLLEKLRHLSSEIATSEWFAHHEFIGSSILVAYDTYAPEKHGLWMIDFGRTEEAPWRLRHDVPWTVGSHEDGYHIGLRCLQKLWAETFDAE